MESTKAAFRKDIEGLRAIAVGMVVAFHAGLLRLKGGFIGVDVFFVLSGYLITGLLMREAFANFTIDLKQFYARRIRRLLPASAAMLLVVMLAVRILLPPFDQWVLSKSILATFAYLSNVYFARASSDYFAPELAGNPVLHTWSLAVEEQFYLVWPLLILGLYRWRRSRGFVCGAMALLGAISFAASLWFTHVNQPVAFFLMPARAWEFVLGALASQVPAAMLKRYRSVVPALSWTGLAVVVASGFLTPSAGFPGWVVVPAVLGTAAVLLAGQVDQRAGAGGVLRYGILQYFGSRSYAVYLWHWPVLVLAAVVVQPFGLGVRLGCVALAVVMAEVSYRVVENPIRLSAFWRERATLCVVASGVVMVVGIGGAAGWNRWARRTPSFATYGQAMLDLPDDASLGCENGFGNAIPQECDFGDPGAATRIVLFGDSHMEQWLPAFQAIAQEKKWRISLFVKSACPALGIAVYSQQAAGEDHWCREWRLAAIERIRALQPAVVILSNQGLYPAEGRPETMQGPAAWTAGARPTFALLGTLNRPVVFLRDTPEAGFEVTECLSRFAWNGLHPCAPLKPAAVLHDEIYAAEQEAGESVPGVHFLDMSGFICETERCDLTRGGKIVYRDRSHLTARYLRSLSPELYRELVREVPELAG